MVGLESFSPNLRIRDDEGLGRVGRTSKLRIFEVEGSLKAAGSYLQREGFGWAVSKFCD